MIDRQKLMSDLEGLTFDDWSTYHCDTDVQGIAIDALELLKSEPHWVSVKDRLPDKQPCEYLVVNANNVETAICLDNRWITPRRVIKITHWMPLPEPPEVKQDD